MMEGFNNRSLTVTAMILFIIVVGLEVSSYFRFTFVPTNPGRDTPSPPPPPPLADSDGARHIVYYERDYQTLWDYIICLAVLYAVTILLGWATRGSKLNRAWRCRLDRLFHTEFCLVSDIRFSLSNFIQASGLMGMNCLVLFFRDRVLVSEGHDLYHQEYANRFAQLAVVNCSVAVALSVRNTALMSGFPSSIRWHVWYGCLGVFCALYHACFQFVHNYARQNDDNDDDNNNSQLLLLLHTLFSSVRYTTGTLMMTSLCVLVFGSHPLVRMLSYRFFRITHIGAFLLIVMVGFIHHWVFAVFYVAVAAMWLRDQYLQLIHTAPAKIVSFKALPSSIVKLQLQPAFTVSEFLPGQFSYVSFGQGWLGHKLHAHPFSVSRFEREAAHDTFTFYIRATGRQTAKLHHMVMAGERPTSARMSGPLGHPLMDNLWFGDFEVVVLVAEGIGITPWISVVQQLARPSSPFKTRKVIVLWTIRDRETLDALKHEFIHTESRVKVFVTRQDTQDLENHDVSISMGRPDYASLFRDIREEYSSTDVALGVCAHHETIQTCGNIARRYNSAKSIWVIKNECFEM